MVSVFMGVSPSCVEIVSAFVADVGMFRMRLFVAGRGFARADAGQVRRSWSSAREKARAFPADGRSGFWPGI